MVDGGAAHRADAVLRRHNGLHRDASGLRPDQHPHQRRPGSATTTITYNIYTAAFNAGSANFGIASALGVVLFVFVFAFTLLQFKFLDKKVDC